MTKISKSFSKQSEYVKTKKTVADLEPGDFFFFGDYDVAGLKGDVDVNPEHLYFYPNHKDRLIYGGINADLNAPAPEREKSPSSDRDWHTIIRLSDGKAVLADGREDATYVSSLQITDIKLRKFR